MNFDHLKHQVAAEVRAAIARAGMTRKQIAEVTGIAEATLSRKCSGATPFNVVDLLLIAAALDIDPTTLIPAPSKAVAA